MLPPLPTLVVTIAILFLLAQVVVRHAERLAARLGLSDSFVGMTVLSVGASLLEIVTHAVASVRILQEPSRFESLSSLIIGTNVGSDVFQQNFVLPLVGLLGAVFVSRTDLLPHLGGLLAASVLLWVLALGGLISRPEGVLLMASYGAYILYLARRPRGPIVATPTRDVPQPTALAVSAAVLVLGCVGMTLAAYPMLGAAEELVDDLGVSASFFGVVILGVATAMPEFTTALVAAVRGRRELSAGVLIGSNVTNPLFSIGLGAAISRYAVPEVTILFDLPVKVGTGLLLLLFLRRSQRLSRPAAVSLLALYFLYLLLRQQLFPQDVPA